MSIYTIEENDNLRVRLEHDDSGEKPYDEGAVPILSRPFRYGRWEAVNDQANDYVSLLNQLQDEFEEDVIDRFIRIFLGAYSVMRDSSENNFYIAFDTAEWREHVGLTDEWLDRPGNDRTELAKGSLTEVLAWANGEVYGYILERRVLTHTTYTNPVTGETIRELDGEDWEQIDSCWGFYGWEYAEQEAKEEFQREVDRTK